ncbi:xanthine dehydrogenase family protein molybdopterin-binding subunit [Acetobacter oeni]|uniref:Uncharacterized protein n=1 Tax=Acetobacter oeni TaxID=304077 RepID=A0A511XMN4_9PROT|nr:hypothetical protein [Acetobacter oeni]MBB3884155.1 hypothetical protein [Acetobacter oeni]NHO20157.1 hypothetical protein [Acetobacter oeni]GBR04396.1 hypothetical protein AA21952_1416 [Acetobacter oeni LMG 21952]GEN64198.1 hypothetical protein AOE01nite_24220 [Acetobacter oeni]
MTEQDNAVSSPVEIDGSYTLPYGTVPDIDLFAPIDPDNPDGPFVPLDATINLRNATQAATISATFLGIVHVVGGLGGSIDIGVPDTRDVCSLDLSEAGGSWQVSVRQASAGDITLGRGASSVVFDGYGGTVTGAYGFQTVDTGNVGATVAIGGSGNTVLVDPSASVDITLPGSFNTVTESSGSYVSDYTSSIVCGAYAQLSGIGSSTVTAGDKSTFSGTFSGDTITAGGESHFDTVSGCDVTTRFKCSFVTVTDSSVLTIERDCRIGTLGDGSEVTTANDLVVDHLDSSSVYGAGLVTVDGSVSGQTGGSPYGDIVAAKIIDLSFGDTDADASVSLSAASRGSVIQGGSGVQTALNDGAAGMTFISADSNTGGHFTAVGNGDIDTFRAVSSMTMTGGAGKGNLFDIVSAVPAQDVITDFMASSGNRLELSGFGLTDAGLRTVIDQATTSASGVKLHLGSQTTVMFSGISLEQLQHAAITLS